MYEVCDHEVLAERSSDLVSALMLQPTSVSADEERMTFPQVLCTWWQALKS
jgi:hypothetical protein